MARTTGKELLEQKIEKAQEDVVKAKKKYDTATALLKKLLDKRDAIRAEEIMTAIAKSDRSYDDIMRYIITTGTVGSEEEY